MTDLTPGIDAEGIGRTQRKHSYVSKNNNMNKLICLLILMILASGTGFLALGENDKEQHGQRPGKSKPLTILDYYMILPLKYVDFSVCDDNDRKKIIKTQDVKNGYLTLEGCGDGWTEIALFRRSDGKPIIAVEVVGCGPGCTLDSLHFLQFEAGKWRDVTKSVLPEIPQKLVDAEYSRITRKSGTGRGWYYELPRIRTTMKVVIHHFDDGEHTFVTQPVLQLTWNGNRFEINKIR